MVEHMKRLEQWSGDMVRSETCEEEKYGEQLLGHPIDQKPHESHPVVVLSRVARPSRRMNGS